MKLWLKISLICICVLFLIVGISSTLLILMSRENILQMTLDNEMTEQHNLQSSFSEMVSYYGEKDLEHAAKYSLIKYSFSRFAKDTSVLVSGEETIYSNITLQPEKILPLTSSYDENHQEHYIGKIDGRHILIVGSSLNVLSDNYSIYTFRDITSIYNNIDQMIWRFCIVSFVCIAMGIALIIILVRFATRPLKSLGYTARRIAKGEYNERVKVSTHDEVGELAEDFNVMVGAVQSHINELKENAERQLLFISGVTHEFKTPLTSVIGHSETLIYTKMPEDIVQNSLFHIYEQCRWLERLTQKLLKLITLQEQIELREESVQDLFEAVKSSMEETFKQQEMTLKVSYDNSVLPMDFDLMLSLIINLADNAVKASKAGQTIQIKAYKNIIEIADKGIGISKEEISKITEPFYVVDPSRNKLKGGSGLGLALVKRIADAHNAEIAIDSILGQGTTVKIIFPVYK